MADLAPGLTPRKLEADIQMDVPQRLQEEVAKPSDGNIPQVPTQGETQAQVKTQATEEARKEVTPQQEEGPNLEDKEFSERASRRFQELANRTAQAEERARRSEEMLQRMVNIQPPAPSQDEVLAKQFKSYDKELGYPTDPKEYSNYIGIQAETRAREAARAETLQNREQAEMNELAIKHPDINADDPLLGSIIAIKRQATKTGGYLTYSQAADVAKDRLSKRFTKEQEERVVKDIADKNEAYVESTRGASPQRSPEANKDLSKMTLGEMEAYLKKTGNW